MGTTNGEIGPTAPRDTFADAASSAPTGRRPGCERSARFVNPLRLTYAPDGATFASAHSVIENNLPARFLVSLRIYVNEAQPGSTSLVVDAIN